jgi:hypothetical protein
MGRQLLRGRSHLVAVAIVLGLGLGGVGLAQRAGSSSEVDVTLLDGTLRVSRATVAPGAVTLVAVNRGRRSHGLAVMGAGLQVRRTRTLAPGATARLVVTVRAGRYMIWDPVRGSMSRATVLTVRASGGTGVGAGGTTPSTGKVVTPGGTSGGTNGTPGANMPGMDPNDPCAGMM